MQQIEKNVTRYLLLFLAVFMPFRELISLYTNSFIKFLPDILIWGELFFVVAINKFKLNLKMYDYFFMAFIFIGFISSFINGESLLAFALQTRSIGTMYVLFYILRNVDLNKENYALIAKILKYVSIIIILFAIVEYLFDKRILFPEYWSANILYASNFLRAYSLMYNPNTFAIFIFMVMFLNFVINKDQLKAIDKVYFVLVFIGIMISASRSTMIVLLLFVIYLLFDSVQKKSYYNLKMLIGLFLAGGVIYCGFVVCKDKINNAFFSDGNTCINKCDSENNNGNKNFIIINRMQDSVSESTISNSFKNGRLFSIRQGLEIFQCHIIIGTGFGTYGSAASKMIVPNLYEEYDLYENFYSDNEYIKVIVETGVLGTLFFCLFILSLFYEFIKKKNIECLFIFVVFLFIGLFYNIFEMAVLSFVLYVSLQAFDNDNFNKTSKNKLCELDIKKGDKMKSIAIFTDNLKVGGIQKSVVNMLNKIDYNKYIVDLYLFDNETFYDIPQNVNVIYIKKPSKLISFIPFDIVYKVYNPKILEKNYDISIDFDSYQMGTAVGALKANSKKKAIWIHNDIPIKLKEEPKYRILHFFFKGKYKHFDSFNAVSQGALDAFKTLENYSSKEYNVIPNYIDTSEIKKKMQEKCDIKIDYKKINIVSVGRLCHQKGIDIMLNNIKKLTEYREDFHLYLIGDGPQKEELVKLTESLDLNDYVTFLGNQKNPFKYLKEMDLFYLSSRYEGQGMVILEAMSVGLDILIPKHLEKYCPPVKGVRDVILFLKKYKKSNKKDFNNLKEYNDNITKKLDELFSNLEEK